MLRSPLALALAAGCVVDAAILSDEPVEELEFAAVSAVDTYPHPEVSTILMVEWNQDEAADEVWLEVMTADGVHTTPPLQATAGTHVQPILGAPPGAELSFRIYNTVGGDSRVSEQTWTGTPGTLPSHLPRPELITWDPAATSEHPYMLLSVDVDAGNWYDGPFYVYILNRAAEVVWYHEVPDSKCTLFARPSQDGTHLAWEQTTNYSHFDYGEAADFYRTSLDLEWSEQLDVPFLAFTWDEDAAGDIYVDSLFTGDYRTLDRVTPSGTREVAWNANQGLGVSSYTATNTVRLFPERGTFLWSMYHRSTVAEVDLQTGELVHLWGEMSQDWRFDPPEYGFLWQHFPGFTPDGNLLISTHAPFDERLQRTWEFELDERDKVLRLVWEFGEGYPEDYADYAGEAQRLHNGNTLIGYGTDGLLREVTHDKDVVWEIDWDADYLIGHAHPLDDLYALNEGR